MKRRELIGLGASLLLHAAFALVVFLGSKPSAVPTASGEGLPGPRGVVTRVQLRGGKGAAEAVEVEVTSPAPVPRARARDGRQRATGAQLAGGSAPAAPGGTPGTSSDSGSTGPGSPEGGNDRRAELHARLAAAARGCYPEAARRYRQQGEAMLKFCLDAAGSATSNAIERSTGSPLLDRATVECVLPKALPFRGAAGCYVLPVQFGASR